MALLALLFQQVAMAAYFCPVETASQVAATDMAMPCHRDTEDPRCAEHCNPHQQAPADLGALTVPMATILPAMAWLEAPLGWRGICWCRQMSGRQ